MKFFLVFAGGGAGAVARYLTGMVTLRAFGPGWPYGTFAVNAVGGLLMGLLAGILALKGGTDQERLAIRCWRLSVPGRVHHLLGPSPWKPRFMIERRDYGPERGWPMSPHRW